MYRVWTEEENAYVWATMDQPRKTVAATLGVTDSALKKKRETLRVKGGDTSIVPRTRRPVYFGPKQKIGAKPGEAHHLAVLTEERVRAFRKQYEEGLADPEKRISMFDMAMQHDVAFSTMASVLTRRSWKHVT